MYARNYAPEPQQPKTFVELVRRHESTGLHLVKTFDRAERACWFLLKTDERSLVKLGNTEYEDILDLTHFGEVIESGWGHTPDEALLRSIS